MSDSDALPTPVAQPEPSSPATPPTAGPTAKPVQSVHADLPAPSTPAEDLRRTGALSGPAISDRQFADVVPQNPRPHPRLTNRGAPIPSDLGPLQNLVGVWRAAQTGWNMIALPFQNAPPPDAGFKFRVLMNQYNEELRFTFIDSKVPNRGLLRTGNVESDQLVVTLDYQQRIAQARAEDRPDSNGLAGVDGLPIHHEPGLWLFNKNLSSKEDQIQRNEVTEVPIQVARLASIPHGNSLLALGVAEVFDGMPPIAPLSGMPSGRFENIRTPDYDFKDDPYLAPYLHYIEQPFMGLVDPVQVPGFPGFSPADMNDILRFANQNVDIVRTTRLTVDTARRDGGITNAPFSTREGKSASMKSTFWIQELRELDAFGKPKLRLQYSQVVMLEFFHPREDELPGKVTWPHISIATLEKDPEGYALIPT